MKTYFTLQAKILKRKVIAFGVQPSIAITLLIILSALGTFLVMSREPYGKYLYTGMGFLIQLSIGTEKRTDFLNSIYSKTQVTLIRFLEKGLVIIPIFIGLVVYQEWILLILLLGLTFVHTLIPQKTFQPFQWTTPYSRHPYEFTIGFRQYLPLFFISLALVILGIMVHNYGISLFGIIIISLTILGFYNRVEPVKLLWEEKGTAKNFLFQKLKINTVFYVLTVAVYVIPVLIFYPNEYLITIITPVIILPYLFLIILLKYSAFPYEMNLPHFIYLMISIIIPPLVIYFVFRFYKKSIAQLNLYIA